MVTDSLRLERRIERFRDRYGDRVLAFAEYASFPLALTSELAYCLRERFTPDLPWWVVPQLLLSSISESIAHDLYELDTSIRNALRLRLVQRFPESQQEEKLTQIADFLGRYIWSKLRQESTQRMKDLGYPPQWIALACLKSANEVAKAIEEQLVYLLANESDPSSRLRLVSMVNDQIDLLAQRGYQAFDLQRLSERLQQRKSVNERDEFHQTLRNLGFPGLNILQFDEVKLIQTTETKSESETLTEFSFATVKVDRFGKAIDRPDCEASYFEEALGNEVAPLKMIAIRSGRFLMGSPEDEEGRSSKAESPQHWVTVPPFFMSETPVTQEQWRFIAKQPKVEIDLEINPRFNGDRLPIERVTWHEAVEFCQRLSAFTRRQEYRLPTEAEWEYACRAGTTTPFAFGETITTELANFNGAYTYGSAPTGSYRSKTTDLGSFEPNAFGLVDMHGNVWEWCQDRWHDRYDGAPVDGSAWESGNNERRILRGGSWNGYPALCRSAFRFRNDPGERVISLGFRVVCALPRTS